MGEFCNASAISFDQEILGFIALGSFLGSSERSLTPGKATEKLKSYRSFYPRRHTTKGRQNPFLHLSIHAVSITVELAVWVGSAGSIPNLVYIFLYVNIVEYPLSKMVALVLKDYLITIH